MKKNPYVLATIAGTFASAMMAGICFCGGIVWVKKCMRGIKL